MCNLIIVKKNLGVETLAGFQTTLTWMFFGDYGFKPSEKLIRCLRHVAGICWVLHLWGSIYFKRFNAFLAL